MQRSKEFRIEKKEKVIKNRKKLFKNKNIIFKNDKSNNYFSKHKNIKCNNPNCLACHYEKLLKIKSIPDQKKDASFKDQIKEEQ